MISETLKQEADGVSLWMTALWRPRPLWLLLLVGAIVSVVHTATLLPVSLVSSKSSFWEFPAGTVGGSFNDIAGPYIGYLYFVHTAWTWPLLLVTELVPPHGINIFWLDAVPWLSLLGKVIATLAGQDVDLFGLYLFACFALPGVAMVWVLWVAGQRSLLAAVAGVSLVCAAPFMVVEWGHPALSSQYLIVLALGIYLLSIHQPDRYGPPVAWLVLLMLAFLTNMYLFAMVGGLWFAALAQRGLDGNVTVSRLVAEAAICVGSVMVVAIVTGIISDNLLAASADGFGHFSMNLGSPLLPQMSGVIAPLSGYFIGMPSQVFAYVGLGALLAGAAAAPMLARRSPAIFRAHYVLLFVLAGFVMLALSHRITLGSRVILEIPLPQPIVHMLGTFRASGRFFWPVGYTIIVVSLLTILRMANRRYATMLLLLVALAQVVDLGPTRAAVWASAQGPWPAVMDRVQLRNILSRARSVMILPSLTCQGAPDDSRAVMRRAQATMEIQLIAARLQRPINSTYTARALTDCAAEEASRHQPLRPGVAYFYAHGAPAEDIQLGGYNRDQVCDDLNGIIHCLLPEGGTVR